MEEERKLGKVLATVFALFLCLVMLVTTVIPDRSYAASISKKKVTVYVGNTTTLSVKGTKKTVKWKSSNKKVATVSSKGRVTGKKTGNGKNYSNRREKEIHLYGYGQKEAGHQQKNSHFKKREVYNPKTEQRDRQKGDLELQKQKGSKGKPNRKGDWG